jgi:hypothetical protein
MAEDWSNIFDGPPAAKNIAEEKADDALLLSKVDKYPASPGAVSFYSEGAEDRVAHPELDTGISLLQQAATGWQNSVKDFKRGAAFIENGFQKPQSNAGIYNTVNKVFGDSQHFSDAEANRMDDELWRSMTPDQATGKIMPGDEMGDIKGNILPATGVDFMDQFESENAPEHMGDLTKGPPGHEEWESKRGANVGTDKSWGAMPDFPTLDPRMKPDPMGGGQRDEQFRMKLREQQHQYRLKTQGKPDV